MYYPVSSLLIEFLILSVVSRQDSYGYEISQILQDVLLFSFKKFFDIKTIIHLSHPP